ncbi:MAG: response regulator [Bdellovibrionales bacterium]|jgi:CheY-like chemotaxis protein
MSTSDLVALIVDDQETMRSIIRRLLGVLNIKHILEAENIAGAIALLISGQQKRPNFIISDLYLDKEGGLDFLNRLKSEEKLRNVHIPVILLTGETNPKILDPVWQAGASFILNKPCSAPELGKAIAHTLGAK